MTRSIGYTSCCTSSIACVCKWQQILVMVFYFFSKFQYKSQTFLRCMSRCSPMLMNSLEVHRVSQGFTEFHRVSTNFRRIVTEIRISADENRVSHGLCRASCRQHLLKIGASSHTLCTSMQRRCQRSGGSGTLLRFHRPSRRALRRASPSRTRRDRPTCVYRWVLAASVLGLEAKRRAFVGG